MTRPPAGHLKIVAAAAVAAIMLASCSSGADTTSTAAASSASPASLAATLLAVNMRVAAQTSYVVTTTTSDGDTSTEVYGAGAVSLDEHTRYGHREVVNDGHNVWIRIDSVDTWRLDLSYANAAADVNPASLVGHWVRVTGTRLATADAPTPRARALFVHPDDTTAGAHAAVHGVDTVEYSDPVARSTIYLTATDAPLPVEVRSTTHDGAESVATYSEYGSAPAVHAPDPTDVIDGTEFLQT